MKNPGGLAAIYTRISADPNGHALGVQRQEADARKLCEKRGWTVAEVFCDNDRSAFSQRKTRPAYQRMLDAIREDKINIVVACPTGCTGRLASWFRLSILSTLTAYGWKR